MQQSKVVLHSFELRLATKQSHVRHAENQKGGGGSAEDQAPQHAEKNWGGLTLTPAAPGRLVQLRPRCAHYGSLFVPEDANSIKEPEQ